MPDPVSPQSSPSPSSSEDSHIATLLSTLDQIGQIDLGELFRSAADPAQLTRTIRERLAALLGEIERALARVRHRLAETEAEAQGFRQAEQRELSRALVARASGQLVLADQASAHAHDWERRATSAESLQHRLAAQIHKLATGLATVRTLLNRLGQTEKAPETDARYDTGPHTVESDALQTARTLAQEIDELNSSAFRKIQEMRDRAARQEQ